MEGIVYLEFINPFHFLKHPNMKKQFLTCLLLAGTAMSLFSQKDPMRLGKVPDRWVEMESYARDTSAEAMVICEFGDFDPNHFTFTWSSRYKIFTREGLNYLIFDVPVESKGRVKGYVFNMVDGKVKREKIDRDCLHRVRVVGDYVRMRVAPPGAREGSVIDLRWTLDGLPYIWQFQRKIPVLHSELRVPDNPYVTFKRSTMGYEPLSYTSNYRWIATDMPAFHPEPYISSENNYMTRMFLEISDIQIPGYYASYAKDWNAVIKNYLENEEFYKLIPWSNLFLHDMADEVRKKSDNTEELIRNATDMVRDRVKWDERETLWPDPALRKIFVDDRYGASADMNFILLKLLHVLDVESAPLLMSTRDEGLITPFFPTISRFNYVITYARAGEKEFFIDASDKYTPVNLVPEKCINTGGLIVHEEMGGWKNFGPDHAYKKMVNCSIILDSTGKASGELTIQYDDYAAARFRKSFDSYTSKQEYLEDFESKRNGFYVVAHEVSGLEEAYGPVSEVFKLEIDGLMNRGGDMAYIDPFLVDKLEENPFKLEKREYPVDFTTARTTMYTLRLSYPDGYEVVQAPGSIRMITKNKEAAYTLTVMPGENTFQCMEMTKLVKPVFLPGEYGELKKFFAQIVVRESEPLVLKRVEASSEEEAHTGEEAEPAGAISMRINGEK